MSRRAWGSLFLAAAGALFLAGCYSPTLPLPPPSRPEVSAPDDAGMVHIRGTARGGSEVFAKNQSSLEIVGKETGPTGVYDLVMPAAVNDRIIVWYVDQGEKSPTVDVWVPAREDGLGGAGGESGE